MTEFSGPKGVPDYVPPESARFVAVRSALLDAARRAGFSDIELPIFDQNLKNFHLTPQITRFKRGGAYATMLRFFNQNWRILRALQCD